MNADLACQHALDRLASAGFDALTEKERTLATVWKFLNSPNDTDALLDAYLARP